MFSGFLWCSLVLSGALCDSLGLSVARPASRPVRPRTAESPTITAYQPASPMPSQCCPASASADLPNSPEDQASVAKATASPCAGRLWLASARRPCDLAQRPTLSSMEQERVRDSCVQVAMHTANGTVEPTGIVQTRVNVLDARAGARALPSTPDVLSIGKRCVHQGYAVVCRLRASGRS